MTKLIVAGSRTILDKDLVWDNIERLLVYNDPMDITIVSGLAKGPDQLGKAYAEEYGIHCQPFPADWGKHGRSAGYIRNKEMAEYADELLAFWDGESNGTKNMIDLMRIAKKKTTIIYV